MYPFPRKDNPTKWKKLSYKYNHFVDKLSTEVILLGKKKTQTLREDKKGIATVQNQLFESYQSGVVEDQLHNNKAIHKYNNQKN